MSDGPLTVTRDQLAAALERAVRYRRSLAAEHERNLAERVQGVLFRQPQWRDGAYLAIGQVLDEVADGVILAVAWDPVSDAVKIDRPPIEPVRRATDPPRFIDGNPWGIR